MKLTDALTLQEGLDPAIVKDIVDIAMRSEFGSISGMDKVAEKEWEDISQLIRYIKEAIPTTTHYLFDTLVSKLDDRLPDTEIAQNLNERYGLPGNAGREFGEKFMRDLIGSGKFAQLWTAFEATYPELQSQLQTTFEKTNDLLRYIKPESGDETYKVSSMPEVVAQELNDLLDDILETLDFVSNQNEEPGVEMVKAVIKDFDNTFSDMLAIFTSNTDSDKPLEPYKQTNMGFKEDALNKSKSNYNNWKKDNSNMKMKKLTEIYEEGIADATSDFKELQLAWRNLDKDQREELLLSYIQPEEVKDIPTMEWEQLWHDKPMLANNPDFQETLLAANFGGNGDVNEDDMEEGTCGYSVDGEGGDEPAGSHLLKKSDLQERFQKLANILK
tara:strand:+ start:1272 stop:2432 length:1161 start_codon:yes stop_codon:yes gene_type:complete